MLVLFALRSQYLDHDITVFPHSKSLTYPNAYSLAGTKFLPPSQADSKLTLPVLIDVLFPASPPFVSGLRPPLDLVAVVRDFKRKLGLPHPPGVRDSTSRNPHQCYRHRI